MELILKYFPELESTQIEQFKKLESLYTYWNNNINVISRKDIEELYLRHVLHSLAIAKFIEFNKGSEILDVGTGGGFPGIPLAIKFPDTQFHLVDSVQKKLKVVDAIVDELQLNNVKTYHSRVENIQKEFDFILSRAVTTMPKFVGWVKGKIKKNQNHNIKNGIIYLKGGELSEELKDYKTVKIKNISDYYEEDFFETKKIVYLPIKYRG